MLSYIDGFGDAGRAVADPAVKPGSWGYHPIPVTTMIGKCEANAKDMGKHAQEADRVACSARLGMLYPGLWLRFFLVQGRCGQKDPRKLSVFRNEHGAS